MDSNRTMIFMQTGQERQNLATTLRVDFVMWRVFNEQKTKSQSTT